MNAYHQAECYHCGRVDKHDTYYSSDFVLWLYGTGWHCAVDTRRSFRQYCPDCWRGGDVLTDEAKTDAAIAASALNDLF